MSGPVKYPGQDDLDELQELMARVDEPEARIDKVVRAAAVDMAFYNEMRELYQQRAAQVAMKDAYYPYTDLHGEFMLGTDLDGHPVGVTRRQLNEHMLVVGRSGAGKTTFFYNVLDTLHDKAIPFLVFDFKNDYRDVVDDFDLVVLNWRDLKFNPLQPPPGVRPERWAETLVDVWAHAMGVFVPSKGYFLRKLRQLYHIYEDEIEEGLYPSLFELRDLVRADAIHPSSPRFNYMERLENRTTMMTGFSGDIFDCARGHPIENLLDQNVVLELQEPNQDVQQFVIEALLTWIFYYRDAAGHRQGLRHAVLFDEAKMVFDVQREQDTDIPHPPITNLMGRVREFGEALIVADHEPSKLSDSLKANTNAKLWMSLGSGHDLEEMAATFGVEDDKKDFTRTLERGEAVLATAESDPVPVVLPPYHVDKTISEAVLQEQIQAVLTDLPAQERVRPDVYQQIVGVAEQDDETGESEPDTTDATADADGREVGEVAEQLLASVSTDPFLSMSERYDAIAVGKKKGNAAKNELLTLELVQEVEVRTGKRGRNPKMLELTRQGKQLLVDRGYDVRETGRRGIEHRYWQHQIKDYYEEHGFETEIEHGVGQEHIDVYAEHDSEQVAVEVARSPEHEVENIRKCLEYGVDRVQVIYLDDDVRERIAAAVRDEFGAIPERVEFVPAATFVT